MTSYVVDLDLVTALATPRTCPGCGHDELVPHPDSSGIAFACGLCARVWHAGAGALVSLHRFPVMRSELPDPPSTGIGA